MSPADELQRLRDLLAPVETAAATLPWADRERWTVATHVGHDGVFVLVDLHGLNAALARDAVRLVADAPPEVGVVWIHGRGGTRGKPVGVLGHVVRDVLGPRCAAHGWRLDPHGPRTLWIVDPSKAPDTSTPWLFLVLVGLAAVAVIVRLVQLGS